MKIKGKKLLSLFLSLVIVFNLSLIAEAFDVSSYEDSGIIIQDNTEEIPLTSDQIIVYNEYDIVLPENVQSTYMIEETSIIDAILSVCEFEETVIAGEQSFDVYSSVSLENCLYNCSDIIEIAKGNDYLFIFYKTYDEMEVRLTYSSDGLCEKIIYDPNEDEAIIIEEDGTLIKNFREGISVTMTDELLQEIYECIEMNDWESLQTIEGIEIQLDEKTGVSILPSTPFDNDGHENISDGIDFMVNGRNSSGVDAFESDRDMLNHLESRFPPYSKELLDFYALYSSALDEDVVVMVTESRDSYVKTDGNWEPFFVGAAITVLSTFLGCTPKATTVILSLLGIGVSAQYTIEDNVSLCNSAVYRYRGSRVGYAYDTTLYQDYVNVASYTGFGEFHGGYTSDGEFEWIHFSAPDAFGEDPDDIADETIYLYNLNVKTHGYCKSYFPD